MTCQIWRWSATSILGALFVSTVAMRSACAQVPLSQCQETITSPGQYVLAQDISCNDGPGVTINASHVHLDTAGHMLIVTFDPAIVINGSHVIIDGGGTIDGASGVFINSAQDLSLHNITIGGNSSFGGGNAIFLNGANGLKLVNSSLSATGQCGFGPIISGTVDNGYFARNNIAGGCESGAIGLVGSGNVIKDNAISQEHFTPSTPAIAINVASGTSLEGNTIMLLGTPGDIVNQVGINLTGDSNTVRNNTVLGGPAAQYGILALQGATANTIMKNSVSGTQFDLFESNGPPCVNIWKNNSFQTNGGAVACLN